MADVKISELPALTSPDGAEELVVNDGGTTKKITIANATSASLAKAGGTMTGDTLHGDNVKAKFGTGGDLEIYHDGSHSRIKDVGTGNLSISASARIGLDASNGDNMGAFNEAGSVQLFHNGSQKLATTSTGVDVTGTVTADGLGVSGNSSPNVSVTSTGGSVTLWSGADDAAGYVGTQSNHPLVLRTNQTERMRIDTSGNVGIGVTPEAWPSAFLGIDYGASGAIFAHRTASEHSILNNAYYDGAWKYKNTAAASRLAFSATGLDFFTAASGSANSALTWAAAASVTANGITFNGDTAAANALDDYETGTFTPYIGTWTGTAPTTTGGTFAGSYTKIGRLVTCQITVSALSLSGTTSGLFVIKGLPFTPSYADQSGSVGPIHRFNFTRNDHKGLQFISTVGLAILSSTNNGGWDWEQNSSVMGSSYIRCSITYMTNL